MNDEIKTLSYAMEEVISEAKLHFYDPEKKIVHLDKSSLKFNDPEQKLVNSLEVPDDLYPDEIKDKVRDIYQTFIDMRPENQFGEENKTINCEGTPIRNLLCEFEDILREKYNREKFNSSLNNDDDKLLKMAYEIASDYGVKPDVNVNVFDIESVSCTGRARFFNVGEAKVPLFLDIDLSQGLVNQGDDAIKKSLREIIESELLTHPSEKRRFPLAESNITRALEELQNGITADEQEREAETER